MERFVKKCSMCMRLRPPVRESMIPSPLPTYPWENVATDLFEFQGQHYLLVVNHFSQYLKVISYLSNEFSIIHTWHSKYVP